MIKIECEVEDLSHLIYHSHREAREMGEAKAERDHEIDRRMAAERALENFKAEQAKLPTITPHNEVRTLIQAINRGDKIGAIKSVRVLLGYGLKDAKDFVEEAMLPVNNQRATNPYELPSTG